MYTLRTDYATTWLSSQIIYLAYNLIINPSLIDSIVVKGSSDERLDGCESKSQNIMQLLSKTFNYKSLRCTVYLDMTNV